MRIAVAMVSFLAIEILAKTLGVLIFHNTFFQQSLMSTKFKMIKFFYLVPEVNKALAADWKCP